ncbi:MAG TPA: hypothetical protein VEY91_10180 [Candidatus Limnocylindria bacterium]|nr:hypothetical protein [Candidatus Limnocylindria bacterium]
MRWLIVAMIAVALSWVAARAWPRLTLVARVLDELRAPRADSWLRRTTPTPREHEVTLEANGIRLVADVYRPPAPARAHPLLFIPGAVPEGKDEPRVPPFARLLARAGFTVVVPDLTSLRALRVHPDNEIELGAALEAVAANRELAPNGTAGLFGVSYAGGLALLVALDPAHAARVKFVATVGAYADLDTALHFLATGRTLWRGRPHVVTPAPYGRLVFLRTFEEFIVSIPDRERLAAMTRRRTADPVAPLGDLAAELGPEGRLLYDLFETARPEQVPGMIERLPPALRERMAVLSPARRNFKSLRARLYLVHARDDGTFPVSDMDRIAALARPYVPVHNVALAALEHVDLEPWSRRPWEFLRRDLPEAWRLGSWWWALLGELE